MTLQHRLGPCDNFPDWQGCECDGPDGHDGPHECVCGAQWDDDGLKLRLGYQGDADQRRAALRERFGDRGQP